MKIINSAILQFANDEDWQLLTPPATPSEEPRDEDLDSSGTSSSDMSTVQPHDEGMEAMESLTSSFLETNLQCDEDYRTALAPPPNRRTGPPHDDKTTLNEPSLASMDIRPLTEPQQSAFLLSHVIETLSPRHLETPGRNLRVPILFVELATNLVHPPFVEVHLLDDLNVPVNMWSKGPGKKNPEDPVVIHSRYREPAIGNDGSSLVRFIFCGKSLKITMEGRYRLSYLVRDSNAHASQMAPLKGRCFATQCCPEFSKSHPVTVRI